LFASLEERGGEGNTLSGGKYEKIEKYFKKFKSSFLENDKLIYMIVIFLILKII